MATLNFTTTETKERSRTLTYILPSFNELVKVSVNTGNVSVEEVNGEEITVKVSDGNVTKSVQTGGTYLPSDSKYVTNQTTPYYNSGGYSGNLSKYIYDSTPSDSKYVTNQTTPYYNSGGYSGTLSEYVFSGTPSDSKYVTNQTTPYYNSGGYSGTLSEYVFSGTPSDSKVVTMREYSGIVGKMTWVPAGSPSTGQITGWAQGGDYQDTFTGVSYNSDGYVGTLYGNVSMRYINDSMPTDNPADYYFGYVRTVNVYGYCTDISGTVYKPDTRIYRYQGNIYKPDTRIYRYQGNVYKPESIIYRYQGNVTRPESDTRVYEYYYKYILTFDYIDFVAPHVNVSGVWREVKEVYTKVDGTWRKVTNIYGNVNGFWKQHVK